MVIDLAGDDMEVLSAGAPADVSAIPIGYKGLDAEFEQTGGEGRWAMCGGTATINGIQLGLSDGVGNLVITGGEMVIFRGVRSTSGRYALS